MKNIKNISITFIFITCLFSFWIETRAESACMKAYKEVKTIVDAKYIHTSQNVVTRCKTYAYLVKNFESWYWKSYKCIKDLNCYWMKKPWYWLALKDVKRTKESNNFLKLYKKWDDNLVFARLYMRYNYNKPIKTFVTHWSHTDQYIYISYMKANYWKTYNLFNPIKKWE